MDTSVYPVAVDTRVPSAVDANISPTADASIYSTVGTNVCPGVCLGVNTGVCAAVHTSVCSTGITTSVCPGVDADVFPDCVTRSASSATGRAETGVVRDAESDIVTDAVPSTVRIDYDAWLRGFRFAPLPHERALKRLVDIFNVAIALLHLAPPTTTTSSAAVVAARLPQCTSALTVSAATVVAPHSSPFAATIAAPILSTVAVAAENTVTARSHRVRRALRPETTSPLSPRRAVSRDATRHYPHLNGCSRFFANFAGRLCLRLQGSILVALTPRYWWRFAQSPLLRS
jgi:hypothetical protein